MEIIKPSKLKTKTSFNIYPSFSQLSTQRILSCLILIQVLSTCSSLYCPNKTPMKNFDLNKYLRTYYEIYYYGNDNFTAFHRCPAENFYKDANGSYSLYGSVLAFKDNERFNWTGNFEMTNPGIFNVTQYLYDETFHYDLYVLGTDYKNWIVIWSCPFLSGKEAGWVMTKRQILVNETLTPQEHREISHVLAKNHIPWSRFTRTINYDCDQ